MPLPVLASLPWLTGAFGALMSFLSRMLMTRGGFIAAALMATLGIQFAVHTVAVEPIINSIIPQFSGLPGSMVQWMAYIGIDKFITTILSAYAAAAAMGWLRLRAIAR